MFVETFWGIETVHRLVVEALEFHSDSTKKGFMVILRITSVWRPVTGVLGCGELICPGHWLQ